MDKTLESQYPRLFYSHKRETIAHPEGAISHDGDCELFNANLGICTCGLHHSLMRISNDDVKKIYPKYYEEMDGKSVVEVLMREYSCGSLWEECESCDGNGGVAMRQCEECEGKGFVCFKMPEPLSKEEIDNVIKDMFKENRND